jgi:hypothetical protein
MPHLVASQRDWNSVWKLCLVVGFGNLRTILTFETANESTPYVGAKAAVVSVLGCFL